MNIDMGNTRSDTQANHKGQYLRKVQCRSDLNSNPRVGVFTSHWITPWSDLTPALHPNRNTI